MGSAADTANPTMNTLSRSWVHSSGVKLTLLAMVHPLPAELGQNVDGAALAT